MVENGNLVVKTKDQGKNKNQKQINSHMLINYGCKITGGRKWKYYGERRFLEMTVRTDISVSGSGNINVGINSFNETKINISGSGNVTLRGKSTNNIDATISGSGNIDCTEITV